MPVTEPLLIAISSVDFRFAPYSIDTLTMNPQTCATCCLSKAMGWRVQLFYNAGSKAVMHSPY